MPYSIVFRKGSGRPWKIVKKSTGETVGSSVTKAQAESSVRARLASEHGGLIKRKKKKRDTDVA